MLARRRATATNWRSTPHRSSQRSWNSVARLLGWGCYLPRPGSPEEEDESDQGKAALQIPVTEHFHVEPPFEQSKLHVLWLAERDCIYASEVNCHIRLNHALDKVIEPVRKTGNS